MGCSFSNQHVNDCRFSLAGCKTTTTTAAAETTAAATTAAETTAAGTTAAATTAAPAGTKVIAVIVPPVENPFFGTMQEIAAAKARRWVME